MLLRSSGSVGGVLKATHLQLGEGGRAAVHFPLPPDANAHENASGGRGNTKMQQGLRPCTPDE